MSSRMPYMVCTIMMLVIFPNFNSRLASPYGFLFRNHTTKTLLQIFFGSFVWLHRLLDKLSDETRTLEVSARSSLASGENAGPHASQQIICVANSCALMLLRFCKLHIELESKQDWLEMPIQPYAHTYDAGRILRSTPLAKEGVSGRSLSSYSCSFCKEYGVLQFSEAFCRHVPVSIQFVW